MPTGQTTTFQFSSEKHYMPVRSFNGTLCNLASKRGNREEKQTSLKTNSSGQLLTAPDRSKKECHPSYFVATRNRNLVTQMQYEMNSSAM